MKIGLMPDERTFESYADFRAWVQGVERSFSTVWLGQHQSWDALTLLALAAQLRPKLSYGTAIALTYPHHPVAMAGHALTTQAVTGNRLTLGVGVSHKPVIEGVFGYSADKPVRHLREYLSVLVPLLAGEAVDFRGDTLRAAGSVAIGGTTAPRLLVAALGPAMLKAAGELADGTIVTWVTPQAIEHHVVPILSRAVETAGKPAPAVVAALPVCVTEDEAAARTWVRDKFGVAAKLPNYGAILARGDAGGVEDVVAAGDETGVERQLRRLIDAGATEIVAMPIGTPEQQARTRAALAALAS